MKRFSSKIIIPILSFLFGCTSNGQDNKNKMNCYAERLEIIKKTQLYNEVMTQFKDTFPIMSANKEYFGVPEVVSNKIDDAIFFNASRTECLLIVLKKNNYGLVFGDARIVRGTLNKGQWLFKPSMEYTYSREYFNGYPDNSFENIALLARYSVLTDGDVKKRGCDIDEYYWFTALKR